MGPTGADQGWVCPAAGHGAWGDHRGVPGGPAEPQLERAKGCPVSEGTTTACPLWFAGTLKTGSAALSHALPPLVLLCPTLVWFPSAPRVPRTTLCPQVEQLFGLGLRPRGECHKVLEMFDWNLEQAGCHLLGSCGPAHHK